MNRTTLSEFGQLLQDVVRRLVDYPEDANLTERSGTQSTLFEISVRGSDHGKVVGRGGGIADAIRQICVCRGGRDSRTYHIEVLEDQVPREERHPLSTHSSHTLDPVMATTALLGRVVQSLVDSPEQVIVYPVEGVKVVVFEVAVEPGDVKRVLGRGGATADALRRILASVGGRENRRFLLTLLEP